MGGLNGPQLRAQADDNSDVQVEGPVPLNARKFISGGDVREGEDMVCFKSLNSFAACLGEKINNDFYL